MPTCNNCGSYISKDFIRVFGDNDGTINRCLNCGKQSEDERHKQKDG